MERAAKSHRALLGAKGSRPGTADSASVPTSSPPTFLHTQHAHNDGTFVFLSPACAPALRMGGSIPRHVSEAPPTRQSSVRLRR